MGLPLNLAMTASEMSACSRLPEHVAWMACYFSPYGQGLSNIPDALPDRAMLILNDRLACDGHSPGLVLEQLAEAVERLGCESVLLDFQRPPEPESEAMLRQILSALPRPAAVTAAYAADLACPVFLAPAPLHIPMEDYLKPWQGRDIWLEAALCQEQITVREGGVAYSTQFPPEYLQEGFAEEALCCRYRSKIEPDRVCFTLFDTRETLEAKLALAQSLGVKRAVGLYQELGND